MNTQAKKLVLPEFHSREEEAAFWDSLDTADYMPDDDEWFTLEWTERDDRCRRCGGGMDTRTMDLSLADGRLVLRAVPVYVCRTPGCGTTQLPAAIEELVGQLEEVMKTSPAHLPPPEPTKPTEGPEVPPSLYRPAEPARYAYALAVREGPENVYKIVETRPERKDVISNQKEEAHQ